MSFISTAFAAETTTSAVSTGPLSSVMSFLPMIVIFILFWFLLIRPQQKKAKLHNKMISELQTGDEVITNSGIGGKISKITDQFIALEVADNVIIKIQKSGVTSKLEKGSLSKI